MESVAGGGGCVVEMPGRQGDGGQRRVRRAEYRAEEEGRCNTKRNDVLQGYHGNDCIGSRKLVISGKSMSY